MTFQITITADLLVPGDVIRKAGVTSHSPITVTEVRPITLVNKVRVYGFNAANPEPRLMFRGISANLPVKVDRD